MIYTIPLNIWDDIYQCFLFFRVGFKQPASCFRVSLEYHQYTHLPEYRQYTHLPWRKSQVSYDFPWITLIHQIFYATDLLCFDRFAIKQLTFGTICSDELEHLEEEMILLCDGTLKCSDNTGLLDTGTGTRKWLPGFIKMGAAFGMARPNVECRKQKVLSNRHFPS